MSQTADFLLEIGVEELPSTYAPPAAEALEKGIAQELTDLRLTHGGVKSYATPRRLAVHVRGLALRQPDVDEEALGPSVKAAYDGDGKPTPALLGFARGKGIDLAAVRRITNEKGEYVCATVRVKGKDAREVLPGVIERRVSALPFPKSMRWSREAPAFRFARPVRWVVTLLDGEVIPARIAGVAAGRETRGHRFLAPAAIAIDRPDSYAGLLERAHVVPDAARRLESLAGLAHDAASEGGGHLVEDSELAEINNFLVEKPVAALGRFAASFLDLPREVIVTAMREHQRFFAVDDSAGRLLPCFVAILNGNQKNVPGIVRGDERVLKARLDDARFYWDADLRKAPGDRVEDLAGITWLEGKGTMLDKARRVESLAGWLASQWDRGAEATARRGALLMKTDLLGEMIGSGKEFASLEGVMGSYYAARHGEPAAVAAAIREHVLPRYADDPLPQSAAGSILSAADRIDSVAGYFLAGKIPSGSEDPYGVRRAANGVVRLLLEQRRSLDLTQATERALAGFGGSAPSDVVAALADFWRGRVELALGDRDVAYDESATVLAAELGFRDPLDALVRAQALRAHRREASFQTLVIGYKRVANILRAEKDAPATAGGAAWGHPAEKNLADALAAARGRAKPAYEGRDYPAVLEVLLGMREAIDAFFTDVLINDPKDPSGRLRRLGLLNEVRALFARGFDLSKIVVEG
jgi:glycyl-tRNA synthetase beta chain